MTSIRILVPMVALLFASVASAQVYYPQSYYSNSYTPTPSYSYSTYGCVVLSSDLSYGSRGSEVMKLQQFLVSQNYPGSGSWMITGYFGTATTQAVRNFQQSAGLPMMGYVDWQTRTAIQTKSCGGYSGYPTYPSYPSNPTYPTYPSYTCGYYPYGNDCDEVEIDRIRPTSGETGDRVTIEGSGFSPTGNMVFFDGRLVATVSSTDDGEELRFTVPTYFDQQSYQNYPYGNQYGYQYGYNNNYWYGGYDRERIDEGTYDVTVRNAYGQTSNERSFRVTDDDNDDDDDLSIEVLSGPSSLEEDEEGEWEVEIEAPDNDSYTVTAKWDDGDTDVETITGDETVTFEHEYDDEGDYDVEFKVSGGGDSDTDTVRVEVEN